MNGITTAELIARAADKPPLLVWNVLTDEYFTGEMIPGSRHVPLDRVARTAQAERIPKRAEIVVYCSGPGCPQSALAAEKLTTLGYTNVRLYEGGLKEWKEAGNAVESAQTPVAH